MDNASDKGWDRSYDEEDDGEYDSDPELDEDDDIEVRDDGADEGGDDGTEGGFHSQKKGRRGFTKGADRVTSSFLAKYERAGIFGTLALQLSKNAPPTVVPQPGETDPHKLAERKLAERKIPFIVHQYLPDHAYEVLKLSELTHEWFLLKYCIRFLIV